MDYLQYVDKDTFLHRLDPRTKFVFLVAMAILTSITKSLVALLFLGVFFLVIWISCGILKEMIQLLKKLKILLIFIFLLWFVLGLFEEPPVDYGMIIYKGSIGPVSICFDWYDFYKGAVYVLRIYLMIASFFMILITTNFSEMILGLCKWHVPYSIAFAVGLIFQIIPIVIGELNAIMEAQSSRGLEIEQCGWATKVKNYIIFSFPLFFRVIGKGQAISLAMHYYKLDFSRKRSSYKTIKASKRDVIFSVATLIAIAVTVVLKIFFYIPV
ncbi:MAG: energy-coupling factor transporter transmembrane protein EcfT [Clostridia bacterium]|nr:energy-coupling factor transporter transmembrane protein EcfT [Clostridia bacterium]